MQITLSDENRKKAIASLRRYASEELDHELNELPAQLFLEFIVREIGPLVYNAAIADAQAYFRDRAADVEGVLYAPEFTYWQKSGKRPTR